MPFTIQAGLKVNLEKNGNPLFSFTVNQDITPNSAYNSPIIDFAGKKLYNEIEIKIENFNTFPLNGPFTISGNENLSLKIDIRNFQLREMGVEANNKFEVIDTTDFSFTGEEMTADAVDGKLKIFIENQFPIKQSMQAYFMDSLYNILDSLFVQPFSINPANVDGQGYSIEKPLSLGEILLNPAKFDKLKNAKFLIAKALFENINNTVSVVRMRRTDAFDIQVVGDLKLKYDLTPKNQ